MMINSPTDGCYGVWVGVGGKHACVDLIGISPLIGLRVETFNVGQAPSKVLQVKWQNMRKHVLTINMLSYHLFLTLLTS
jgi:hypothetical protein